MTVSSHVDESELRLFVTGILSAKETERIEGHLRGCGECRTRLDQQRRELGTPDPARNTPGLDETREIPSSDRLAKEALAFELDRAPSRAEPGRIIGQSGTYAFLAPAEKQGELGRMATYRVLRLIGSGGMGMVFEAEDVTLQRRVALKVMKPEMAVDLKARERFLLEARTAASVPHDNIVTIFQVGQFNDIPFLAMQYLEGESLEARLEREGPLPLADVLRIGREVALGLSAAHREGLIHRDIKPANIWLEIEALGGPFKRVRLLDFGLARPASSQRNLTGTGLIVGTPGFLAPEQAKGLPLDHRCDLFSLGCVLYCMICGAEPFGGTDVLAVLSALATEDPKPLEEHDPKVPPALSNLVHQLLAKKPEERPGSAGEVAEELMAIAEEQNLSICPVGSGERRPPSGLRQSMVANRRSTAKQPMGRNRQLAILGGAGLALLLAAGLFFFYRDSGGPPVLTGEPIKVGILHSQSGTMRESGESVTEATKLAIREVNDRGGVLGRRIEYIEKDGGSDEEIFAQEATKLITQDKVVAIFGCWTSAGRKAVKRVVEEHNNLLLYPVQYEGLEQSPNIIYLGATPNQQILPAIQFAIKDLGKRKIFLVGSDYVFPRAAHAIIREALAKEAGVQIVGEEFIPLGNVHVAEMIKAIQKAQPDLILNTINGTSNNAFFDELRNAGITSDKVPTISFSVSENELRSLDPDDVVGDYAAWNYFMSLERPENQAFVKAFRTRFGQNRVVSDPMESAYVSVYLWAQAAEAAKSTEPVYVREALRGREFNAPQGTVKIDKQNLHTWKPVRVGQITQDRQFKVVYEHRDWIRPEPFPSTSTLTPLQWQLFLEKLYQGWGKRWEAPRR